MDRRIAIADVPSVFRRTAHAADGIREVEARRDVRARARLQCYQGAFIRHGVVTGVARLTDRNVDVGIGQGLPFFVDHVERVVRIPRRCLLSIHLSGTVNGLTHVIAFAGETSAVASAPTSTVLMPNIGAMNVDTGLPVRRCAGRARVRSGCRKRDVLRIDRRRRVHDAVIARFGGRNRVADGRTGGGEVLRIVVPKRHGACDAPASAAFCDSVRATINMPTSTASIVALRNATFPLRP